MIFVWSLIFLAGSGLALAEPTDRSLSLAAAMQSGYFDELDLEMYESLEERYGTGSRVIRSENVVRVGELAITAKLVVPRSTAPAASGFLAGNDPLPVRLMLDYALVSCASGCRVSLVSDVSGVPKIFEARHHYMESGGARRRPVGNAAPYKPSDRVASMILIEGKAAKRAIEQISASRRVDVFLTAAVHGSMRFTFAIGEQ